MKRNLPVAVSLFVLAAAVGLSGSGALALPEVVVVTAVTALIVLFTLAGLRTVGGHRRMEARRVPVRVRSPVRRVRR